MRASTSLSHHRLRAATSRQACRCLSVAALFAGFAPNVHAWDYLKLRLSASLRADDNVFRLPDGATVNTPGGAPKRNDVIHTIAAGASYEIPISRQKLLLSYDQNFTRYTNFTNLDYRGRDARLTWLWEAGRLATGSAGLTQTKLRSDFAISVNRAPNILTTTREFVNGNYPFHANWQVNWGASRSEGRNSDDLNKVSDNNATIINGELRHVTGRGSYAGLQWTHSGVDYLTPFVVGTSLIDNSYKQDAMALIAGYTFSGVSSMQGSLSRTRRNPVDATRSNSSATTGSLVFNWQPTGMVTVLANLGRDFAPPENITVNGSVINTIGVAATWKGSAAWSVRANASYQDREFLFTAASSTQRRRDTTNSQSVAVIYSPIDKVSLTLSASREHRDSDLPQAIYSTKSGALALEMVF